jgi:hypothetical protein
VQNVRKCLRDVATVYVIAIGPGHRDKIHAHAREELKPQEIKRTSFLTISDLLATPELDAKGGSADLDQEESSVLGYKVKTNLSGTSSSKDKRSDSLIRTVLASLRRKREP